MNADNVNQDLVDFETQIKAQDRTGTDIPFVKLQLEDNQVRTCHHTNFKAHPPMGGRKGTGISS